MVSEKMQDLEINRDEENIREKALIVYYDLQLSLGNLRDLYISCVLNKGKPNPQRIFLSTEWIKNIANLRNGLLERELNQIYHLFEDLMTIQTFLQEDDQEGLIPIIKRLAANVFADFIPEGLLLHYKDVSISDLISIDLYVILRKIQLLTFPRTQIKNTVSIGKDKNKNMQLDVCDIPFYRGEGEILFQGKGELFSEDGIRKCSGFFEDSLFMTGEVYGRELYHVHYETTGPKRTLGKVQLIDVEGQGYKRYFFKGDMQTGEILDGITTEFHSNGVVKFRGHIKDGVHHGEGCSYDVNGNVVFEGVYENDERKTGKRYKNGKEYFSGDFINGRPRNGYITNFSNDYFKDFTGEIRDGNPYTGKGKIFKRDHMGRSLDERLADDNYEPESMPDGLEREIYEDDSKRANEYARSNFREWDEFIEAEWTNGAVKEREDTEANKTLYY